MIPCPCGLAKDYAACCGAIIEGDQQAKTPEALMRSRYTAYTQANIDYIARTMKSPASDHFNRDSAQKWAEGIEWLRLKVIDEKLENHIGYVEFLAYFKEHGKQYVMHELSEFHLEEGRWYYVNGQSPKEKPHKHMPEVKPSRNDACHCGSGQKYKKCCGKV